MGAHEKKVKKGGPKSVFLRVKLSKFYECCLFAVAVSIDFSVVENGLFKDAVPRHVTRVQERGNIWGWMFWVK